jgi:hypothetical protein
MLYQLMHPLFLGATALTIGCGSSKSPVHETEAPQHFLVQPKLSDPTPARSLQDMMDEDRRLAELQSQADTVFELRDWKTLKVLSCKLKRVFPSEEFSLVDLHKYLRGSRKPIDFVVVYIPPGMPIDKGTSPDDVTHEIVRVMGNGAVRRLMFQSRSHGLLVEVRPKSSTSEHR